MDHTSPATHSNMTAAPPPAAEPDPTDRTLKLLDGLAILIREVSELNRRIRNLEQQHHVLP